MDANTIYLLRLFGSMFGLLGFMVSCGTLGAFLVLELGVWMGVLRRRSDDDED